MFSKKSVIAIGRGEFTAANIDLKSGKIIKSYRSRWSKFTLVDALAEAKKELKLSKVRMLVADNLSYNLEIYVPKELSGDGERKYISDYIKTQIPDDLSEAQWDYKETGVVSTKKGEQKKVFVFAPVAALMDVLKDALPKVGLKVEAIEPQIIAATRNKDPMIGLALKKDISGEDSRVLNLNIDGTARGFGRALKWKRFAYAGIVVFLLINVFGFYYYRTLVSQRQQKAEIDQKIAEQDELIYSYGINIQYSSEDDVGLVENLLKENGFMKVDTALIDTEGYVTTVVRAKDGVDDAAIGEVRNSLREFDTLFPGSKLSEDSFYDIEIILGRRNSD